MHCVNRDVHCAARAVLVVMMAVGTVGAAAGAQRVAAATASAVPATPPVAAAPSATTAPSATPASNTASAPATANASGAAPAPTGADALPIPRSRTTSADTAAPIPPPQRFVTKHTMRLRGRALSYTAIAGETYLSDARGDAIGSIFSFSYLKDGPRDPQRPVLFVFNGGPGSSSIWLHMGIVGPRRVALDREVNPSNTPPFGLVDNADTLLDVADLVFIDPVGTGWSRVIGKGTTADFWGVDEDADATAQFIELWITEHRRWNSPKFVMGESYGSIRAPVLARALMGGPLYVGRMRGITLNGIVLLGTTLDAIGPQGQPNRPLASQALHLPAQADAAWYHARIDRRGRSLEAFHEEVTAFARGPFLTALGRERDGKLPAEERAAIVAQLIAYTSLPADAFANSLLLPDGEFARKLLAADGLQLGTYDSRYTLPLANSGNDPVSDDPAMGRYVPGFVASFHELASEELKIRMDRPYGSIVWKDLLPAWNWKRVQATPDQSFATDLGIAMRRNEKLRVLVASGYYDLATHSATAEASIAAANLPADRVALRRYASGHMLYLGGTAAEFSSDVRKLIDSAR